MRRQRTVAGPVVLEGVGLHRGVHTRLTILPAGADSGLVFVREDLGGREVPALQQHRTDAVHASRLAAGEASVDTPEHLLAALFALGVDNARLHLSGSEVPILDGSALPFARALVECGLATQDRVRPEIVVTSAVSVGDEDRRLEILPGDGLRLTAGIEFEHRHLGYQELTVSLEEPEDFLAKLAPARTFALRRDVEKLQRVGLARGGSFDNAILVDDGGVRGLDLRFPDEFVRHKLLDVVGDLALLGCGLRGRIVAWRSGHDLHGRLADALLSDRSAWVWESAPGGPDGPPARPRPPGSGG
ncbi:MAG: UDP-3-O-[3-hydroxymyristoyl] N-acetylglucosamine deacetylase [Acidobacteria bacterium]|nr:UDP-3-O-[3-hydroxymyristoyl] N-acetylglucosamine deacetylase [Acidobacteriota bacterium]